MVGEAEGVLENAAANHEAVNFGIFCVECECVGAVFDVAVDDKFGFGRKFGAQFDNFGNQLVVRGDFAHFFSGAQVNGESGGAFVEQKRKPVAIFVKRGPAESSFDRNWEVRRFASIF